MRLHISALLLASAFVAASLPASAQKFTPKTIQFQGAPDYSNDELLAAAGLKPGETLSSDEMQAHMNQLSNTGLFDGIKFTFNGQDLVFLLKPAANLYSVRLANLPLTPGPELDAKIHARLPLYHGKVPTDGTLLDGVQAALIEQLAAEGINNATITSAPYNAAGEKAIGTIAFSATSPQILIGEIHSDSATPLVPKAQQILTSITGLGYDAEGTPAAIVKDLSEIYTTMGYLDAKVDAARQPNLVITNDAVRVPIHFSLDAGTLYKVTAIQLAPDMLVSQADFDKQSHIHPGDPADAEHIAWNWHFIERQYHNRGYAAARITPTATLDHAQHTVSYAVTAEQGAVYKMGKLTIVNVSDDLRKLMLAAWKMPEGAVFDESKILSFYAADATVNPQLSRIFHAVNCGSEEHLNDDTKTVDVVLKLEKRAQ